MHRCVVLHRNASSELQDVHPALHQKLRHLEYKRFVVELVRDGDGLSSTAPLYCQFTPSPWQTASAAKQLWGRRTGTIRLFDEDGHLVQDATESAGTPFQGMPAVPPPSAQTPPASEAAPTITDEDVQLVTALARFVEHSSASPDTPAAQSRDALVERVRALAAKLARLQRA